MSVEVQVTEGPGAVLLKLSGVIDERFDERSLASRYQPITILDLNGIRRITSFGVRQWSQAMKGLPSVVKHLYLVRCPPCFVDQLNLVLNLGGRSEVVTASMSCFCDSCGDERAVSFDVLADRAKLTGGQMSSAVCPTCNANMELQDDPQQFFRFASTYGAKSIDTAAAALLEKAGLYRVQKVGKPPEELKLVQGDVTLFRISGTLDQRFRPRRLASGVEGHVVIDLKDVESVDATGGQRWAQLLEALAGVHSLLLVDLPDVVLPSVADGSFSLRGARLYSVNAAFLCSCGIQTRSSVGAAEAKGQPGRRCSRCGNEAKLMVDPQLLAGAFAAAPGSIPSVSEDVIRRRDEIFSRAKAESTSATTESGDGLNRYRVVRPLTHGGMAEILLAVHAGIGGFEKLIALKKIRREMLEKKHIAIDMFLNEAKIAAYLNHPNIVQIFEVGQHGGDLFIAMEYVHGSDLRNIIKRGKKAGHALSLNQSLFITSQVAAALHHAHTAHDLSGNTLNIVHRDISPSNVVIAYEGQVKLVDFGIAVASTVEENRNALVGKFSYMSPEQVRMEKLDRRSDIYSLGVVLYEALAQKHPFRRTADQETIKAVLNDQVPSLTTLGIPDFVDEVVRRAMTRDREQRYQHAREFELALNDCLMRLGSTTDSHELGTFMHDVFGEEAKRKAIDGTAVPPQQQESGTGSPNKTGSGSVSASVSATYEASGSDFLGHTGAQSIEDQPTVMAGSASVVDDRTRIAQPPELKSAPLPVSPKLREDAKATPPVGVPVNPATPVPAAAPAPKPASVPPASIPVAAPASIPVAAPPSIPVAAPPMPGPAAVPRGPRWPFVLIVAAAVIAAIVGLLWK